VSRRQLKIFIETYEEVPYKVLNYIGAAINYGGRVTDDKDVRLIDVILRGYMNENMLQDDYYMSKSGIYRSIPVGDIEDYIDYIKQLPLNPDPEAFGLHDNAEITTNQISTSTLLEDMISMQPKASKGKGKSRE
jgi:dynein heavy chain